MSDDLYNERDPMLDDPNTRALIDKGYAPIQCFHLQNSGNIYRSTPGIPESVQATCHKCKRFIYS